MAIIIKSDASKLDGSYVTVEEADSYFNALLNTEAWESADVILKTKALVTATSQIDSLNFIGFKLKPNQPLAFPRTNRPLSDVELIKYQARSVDIPQDIKKATLEQAIWLIKQQSDNTYADMQAQNIKSYAIDDVSISFDLERYNSSNGLCMSAKTLLNKYIVRYRRLI